MNPKLLFSRLHPRQILALIVLLVTTMAVAAFIWWAEVRREEATAQADFERSVDQVFNALAGRLGIFQTVLRAGAATWAEHPNMSVNQWNTFVQRSLLDAGYPGVSGLAFAVQVTTKERPAFIADIQHRLWRDFTIHPTPTGDMSGVVTHIAPLSRSKAVGYDIATHPQRWQAALLARDSGQSTLSPRLALFGEAPEQNAFLLIQPVYRSDYPLATLGQRRQALMGWLLLGLHAPTMIGVLTDHIKDPLLDVQVFAGPPSPTNRIYGLEQDDPARTAAFTTRRMLDFAGARWTIEAHHHLPRSALWFGPAPLTTLAVCVAFGLALTASAFLLLVSREQSRLLAERTMGQLGRAEQTLAGITASVPGTVFQWLQRPTGENGFSFVSDQAASMFGIAPQTLIADWHHLPFAASEVEHWPQAMAQAAAGTSEWQMEGTYRLNEAEPWRWWKCTASPSPGEDGIVALNGMFFDITDQKDVQRQLAEREQTYREMFQRTSAVKVLIDPESRRIVDANAAARAYYGYADDAGNGYSVAASSLLDSQELGDLLWRSAAGQQQFYRSRHRTAGGEIREVEVHMGPVRMHGRQYVHAIVHDVTDRERYQAELVEKTAKLESSNAELQQFSYVASHDLQEPLRTISSFLQLLERRYNDKLDDDGRQFIDFAVDAASRLQAMIQDLLEYSRVGTKGRPFAPTDMAAVFERVGENLTVAIADARADIQAGALPQVVADQVQMVSLLQNLLGNALKYRRDDIAPVIRVDAVDDGDRWVFSVTDNGIGIDPQYYDRIFLVFQRLHTREKFGGTGIGLALCRKIVQRHGGEIWLDSVPGQGTTFYFSLPKRPLTGEAV